MMRTKAANITEYQRKICVRLHKEGFKQVKIADILEKTQGYVSQVLGVFKSLGYEGLREKKAHGAVSRLNETQKEELRTLINNGATKYGFEGDIWNRKRVKLVIEEKFGIVYCERQADRIMKKMGYTIQKPQRKDYRQKEEDIKHWKETTLPAIKKKQGKKGG